MQKLVMHLLPKKNEQKSIYLEQEIEEGSKLVQYYVRRYVCVHTKKVFLLSACETGI